MHDLFTRTIERRQRLTHFLGSPPEWAATAFIAPTAIILGRVRIGADAGIFYGAVLRGDIQAIEIGARSNVQDNAVVHVSDDYPALIGEEVTIGHLACVHACTIADGALIGMQATVLDGAEIGEEAMVGAGALVPPGAVIPPGMLAVGLPARVVRALRPEERRAQRELAAKYVDVSQAHRLRVGSRTLPSAESERP